MARMEKSVGREKQKKKQESMEHSPALLRKKRGRKNLSPSPPSPNPTTISFFKVMLGDFKDLLYIPPMAACTLKGLDKKYVYIEDAIGKYWNVKMSLVGGSLAFQKGWDDFSSAHSIAVGEFVLFTYTGGLLFTARIFGTSSLERVDFQVKKRRGKYAKERCTTELKPDNFRQSKRKKASHESDIKLSLSDNEPLRILKRGKETVQFNPPRVQVVEGDPIYRVIKLPNLCEKPLQYDSNAKESGDVFNGSEQTWHRNVDTTVEEAKRIKELNVIFPTEQAKPGTVNLEAVDNKSIINRVTATELVSSLFYSGATPILKQENELDTVTNFSTFTLKAHSEIKEGSSEISESHKMGINGKMEESNSDDLETLGSEPHSDNMPAQSDLEHVECSPMEFHTIERDGIVDKVVQTTNEICYTLGEKLSELELGTSFNVNDQEEPAYHNEHATFGSEISVPCEAISVVSSNSILNCDSNKNENLMPTNEECGDPQIKGNSTIAESCLQSSTKVYECKYENSPEIDVGHDVFNEVDEKDDTPCSSCRSRAITERRDSVDLPSSNCSSFSVCLSDDVQTSLELPKNFASQLGKLKSERKIVVLQDLSMKCWPVLYHQNPNFTGLIGGWLDFARANSIRRGDICDFELVSKAELKFRVQINKRGGSLLGEEMADRRIR